MCLDFSSFFSRQDSVLIRIFGDTISSKRDNFPSGLTFSDLVFCTVVAKTFLQSSSLSLVASTTCKAMENFCDYFADEVLEP
eukprot:snap_masked-scaffold_38-processed-gene-1.40-mRNA-1 protein AED:1.00 eAED:1.00 QI:0/0/0/0/1/1/2/0/81